MTDLLKIESAEMQNPADNVSVFVAPGNEGSFVTLKPRYGNFIGGEWVSPVKGGYMADVSPVNGEAFCQVARSTKEDVELALDAAHRARQAWGETSLADRAKVLNRIADVLEANLTMLAVAESWETASRCARRSPQICPSRSTTFATSRAPHVRLRGEPLRLIKKQWPFTFMNLSVSWVKSFPLTFLCSWRRGRSLPHWRRATAPW